jgi:predicted nucleic acid-binding protein
MGLIKTNPDACVLIAASQNMEASTPEWRILQNPNRDFYFSDYLTLEIMPKAILKEKVKSNELKFLRQYINNSKQIIIPHSDIILKAIDFCTAYELKPLDALHTAAACLGEIDEFISSEKTTAKMYKVNEIKVIHIDSI